MDTEIATINDIHIVVRKQDRDTNILLFFRDNALMQSIPEGFRLKIHLEGGGVAERDSTVESFMPFFVLYNRRSYTLEVNGEAKINFTFTPEHVVDVL